MQKKTSKQSSDVSPAEPQPVSREVTRKDSFTSFYANDIQVQTSPWDMRLVFGELGDPIPGPIPTLRVIQLGELRMSPQFAKKMVQVMNAQLEAYERNFGKIPEIPDR